MTAEAKEKISKNDDSKVTTSTATYVQEAIHTITSTNEEAKEIDEAEIVKSSATNLQEVSIPEISNLLDGN